MKSLIILALLASSFAFGAEKNCSESNTKTFLKHYLPFISAVADGYYKSGEIVTKAGKEKWNIDKVQTEYANIHIMMKPKIQKHMDEMTAFQKAHPECNEKQILASLTEKK